MKQIDKKVSVVMPVYNAEKFLREALLDVQRQTYKNIEIICVDDGSNDKSVEIIKAFIAKDERFHLISQQNLFAGVARNAGMMRASGEYIIFLDADDRFKHTMIQELVEVIDEENVDVVYFGYDIRDNNGKTINTIRPCFSNKLINTESVRESIFQLHSGAPWMIFYRRSYLKRTGIQFSKTLNCNDIYFTCLNAALAKQIFFFDKVLLHYRTGNPNSLQGASAKNIESFFIAMKEIYEELSNRRILHEYLTSLKRLYIENVYFHSLKDMDYGTLQLFFDDSVKLFNMSGMSEKEEIYLGDMPKEVFEAIINNDFSRFIFYRFKNVRHEMNLGQIISWVKNKMRMGR